MTSRPSRHGRRSCYDGRCRRRRTTAVSNLILGVPVTLIGTLVLWRSATPSQGLLDALRKPQRRATVTTSRPQPSVIVPPKTVNQTLRIRVRRTQECDLDEVAHMLATASTSKSVTKARSSPWLSTNWKAHMDQIWAQADIKSLLKHRWQALQYGRQAYRSILPYINNLSSSESEQLSMLWYNGHSSPYLRSSIHRAAHETGEDNVWLMHRNDDDDDSSWSPLPPASWSWLQHVQLTAYDETTAQVLGFCEVAMLRNPMLEQQQQQQQECTVVDDVTPKMPDVETRAKVFAPAVTNLATATRYRRRGVASRLLRVAHLYVARNHWQRFPTNSHFTANANNNIMGLYVQQENAAAVALYQKLGYTARKACDHTKLGDLLYMQRPLSTIKNT